MKDTGYSDRDHLRESLGTIDRLKPEAAIHSIIRHTMQEIGSCCANWLGVAHNKDFVNCPVAEMFNDWYIAAGEVFWNEGLNAKGYTDVYGLYMKLKLENADQKDLVTYDVLAQSGKTRAILRSEILSDEDWCDHWVYKDYHRLKNIGDVLYIVVNVDEDCESWFVFYKEDGTGYFTEEHKRLAWESVMTGYSWSGQMMALLGLTQVSRQMLSPKEQRVLRLVLEAMREKEIADVCDVSIGTVRSQLSSIYRKFGVAGKVELLSMFVRTS